MPTGKNLFSGGFLGLDNIGVFDRLQPMPGGGQLRQADGTAWMAFYASTMLSIALELAERTATTSTAYEDMASKFFEHFVQIVDAMNTPAARACGTRQDGFYYDQIDFGAHTMPLRIRSVVGLLPLIAVEVLDCGTSSTACPASRNATSGFSNHRPDLSRHITY
jgi:hypothetical protein